MNTDKRIRADNQTSTTSLKKQHCTWFATATSHGAAALPDGLISLGLFGLTGADTAMGAFETLLGCTGGTGSGLSSEDLGWYSRLWL